MTTQVNIPYVVRTIERDIARHERDLAMWRHAQSSADAQTVRQAIGNIPSTESRLSQLGETRRLLIEAGVQGFKIVDSVVEDERQDK